LLFLDLTSKSDVYNPISPQGQWLYHKFGKRNFPKSEIDFLEILHYIKSHKTDNILCHSYFGDPLYYSNIISLAEYCNKNNINLMIFTYGNFNDKKIIDKLSELNTKIYIFLSGYEKNNSLIYHNSSWNNISYILKTIDPNNIFIEYSLYNHNVKDLIKICDLCYEKNINLKYFKGNTLGSDVCNIIDQKGEWLFDIYRIKEDLKFSDMFLDKEQLKEAKKELSQIQDCGRLFQSTQGYLLLRTCIYERNHKNIFNTKLTKFPEFEPELENDTYINFLGYVFNSRNLYETFNNSLCDDWSFYIKKELTSDLQIKLNNSLSYLKSSKDQSKDKDRISLMDKEQEEMENLLYKYQNHQLLSFLSNSNLEDYHISKQF